MKAGKKSASKSSGKNSNDKEDAKEETKKEGKNNKTEGKGNSKKKNKEEDKKEENKGKEEEKKEEKKEIIKYNLDFIYRRERYILKNLVNNILVSRLKALIAKKISVDVNILKFYYKDKELKQEDNKKNVYEMIKGDSVPFIDVKKESVINQNIISLNSKVNLVYKVKCYPITSYIDFVNKIEQFFKDICIENHYLCEPTSTDSYDVCFSCSDHCFQFKRYMMNVSRTDKLYEKTKFEIPKVDKSKIIEPKLDKGVNDLLESDENPIKIEKMVVKDKKTEKTIEFEYRKIKHKETDYFQKEFVNVGPYESYEEIKKKQDKDDKRKWISKKNFSVI